MEYWKRYDRNCQRAVKYGPDLSDANSLLATLMAKEFTNAQKKNCNRKICVNSSDLNPSSIISIYPLQILFL